MESKGVKRSRSKSPEENSWKRLSKGDVKKLFVTNLPYELKWQELKDVFKQHVGNNVKFAELYQLDGRPSGSGTVELKDRETAELAIEKLNRFELMGRKIIVREETSKDKMKFDQNGGRGGGYGGGQVGHQGGGQSGGHGGGGMYGSHGGAGAHGGGYDGSGGYGSRRGQGSMERNIDGPTGTFSVNLMSQLGIRVAEITNQVFVANLDYKVTRQKLEEVFRIAGNVIDADIKVDKDGKSRGMGVVRFEHPIEAVQAISLFTNQILYDRKMYVRMDRWVEPVMQELPARLPSGLRALGVGMGAKGRPLLNVAEIANTLTLSMLVGDTNPGGMSLPNNALMGSMGGGGMMVPQMPNNLPQLPPPMRDNASNLLANMMSNISGGGGGPMGGGDRGGMGSMDHGGGGMNMPMNNSGGGMDSGGIGPPMKALLNALTTLNNNIPNKNYNNNIPNNNYSSNNGNNNAANTFGTNLNSQYNGDSDSSTTIFIKNLPYTFKTNDLYNRFGEMGDIRFAEVKLDHQGNSKGFAIMQYYSADSAQRAINNMNGARIEGRPIEVRLDRVA